MDIESNEHEDEDIAGGPHEQKAPGDAPAGAIDIAKLTAKVYRLMLDELRLEQARGAATRNR